MGRISGSQNMGADDQLLISEIHKKNKTVFEKVYKQFYRTLYMTSFQYVENHEVAEEIVHDVFIRIWNRPDEIVIERSLKAYLVRAVVNTSLNYLKKEKTSGEKFVEYSKSGSPGEADESEHDANEQRYHQLEHALEQLPPQCKKVMMLSKFEKLKQQQIAEQMGISIKTVKNHLTYGFNKMRAILYK